MEARLDLFILVFMVSGLTMVVVDMAALIVLCIRVMAVARVLVVSG